MLVGEDDPSGLMIDSYRRYLSPAEAALGVPLQKVAGVCHDLEWINGASKSSSFHLLEGREAEGRLRMSWLMATAPEALAPLFRVSIRDSAQELASKSGNSTGNRVHLTNEIELF